MYAFITNCFELLLVSTENTPELSFPFDGDTNEVDENLGKQVNTLSNESNTSIKSSPLGLRLRNYFGQRNLLLIISIIALTSLLSVILLLALIKLKKRYPVKPNKSTESTTSPSASSSSSSSSSSTGSSTSSSPSASSTNSSASSSTTNYPVNGKRVNQCNNKSSNDDDNAITTYSLNQNTKIHSDQLTPFNYQNSMVENKDDKLLYHQQQQQQQKEQTPEQQLNARIQDNDDASCIDDLHSINHIENCSTVNSVSISGNKINPYHHHHHHEHRLSNHQYEHHNVQPQQTVYHHHHHHQKQQQPQQQQHSVKCCNGIVSNITKTGVNVTGNPFDDLNHQLCQSIATCSHESSLDNQIDCNIDDHSSRYNLYQQQQQQQQQLYHDHTSHLNQCQINDCNISSCYPDDSLHNYRENVTDDTNTGKSYDCMYLKDDNSLIQGSGNEKIDLTSMLSSVNDKVSHDNCILMNGTSCIKSTTVTNATPFTATGPFIYDKMIASVSAIASASSINTAASSSSNSIIYPVSDVITNEMNCQQPVKKSHCKIVTFQEPISVNYPIDKVDETKDKFTPSRNQHSISNEQSSSLNNSATFNSNNNNNNSSWLNFGVNAFVAASNLHSIVTRMSSGNNHHQANVSNDDLPSVNTNDI